jgi:uncharacterized protein (DUF433 family)
MSHRIALSPQIHFGKPCVAGTRITVQQVLELVEAEIPFQPIIADYYPELTLDDVHACLRYAIDLIAAEEIHATSIEAA